jgi:NAD(P)-dependent dehydrogenase (short-subunit alcohol dehydrogenase family)
VSSKRLEGRIALVTGASRGIGRAVALHYAAEGAHVIAFARTQGALEELDDEIKAITGEPATLVAENLTNFDKIDQVGAALYQRYGKLDIVVGNAATLGTLSPLGHYKPKQWEDGFKLNVHAQFRLIRSFDPLLRASDAGRAIFVTTGAVPRPRMYWGLYAASKAALETMVKVYADEVKHTNVRANLINPGPVRTKMRAQAFPGEDPMSLPPPEAVTESFVELAEVGCTLNGEVVQAKIEGVARA